MRAGDCWLIQFADTGPRTHLWFLLTGANSNGQTVIASLTTLRHNADQTVILQPDDHPFIRHPSFVLYSDCRIISTNELEKWHKTGFAQPQPPFMPAVLALIQKGAFASDFTPRKVARFLVEMGVRAKR
jgi:hypothetical protein